MPVPVRHKKETVFITEDEHPRSDVTLDDLAKLKAAFKDGGSVTAGNASGVNDGACAVLITSEDYAKKNHLTPKARILSTASAGVDPAYMGLGPIPATEKALKRANLTINDIGIVELNEAFASQSLACIQKLKLDPKKVNINGGAIALGHPLGMSGARIIGTLINALHENPDARYGLATMCVGVGQGVATIIEKL